MGLTLAFYATTYEPLFEAVVDLDFETIDSLQIPGQYADLSLHITPADLELLSIEVCNTLGQDPISFREHLDTDSPYVDEPDRGAFVMRQGWIHLISGLERHSVGAVVSAWCKEMSRAYDDSGISTTPEAIEAMRALVETCHYARTANSEVVHVWFA